MSLIVKLKQ